ncbi:MULTISPECIES: serine/threonine-protein kinase [unclassified Nocardioides]|uniref:serine/threonine-protein kinase n=1 Tax=unclassified Nocardioides TaxID=2615069 RepID=UPI001E2980EA|nr:MULTISPECIES: serine/threonine-protein kinase [unclassified Nocardioides]
MPRRLGRYAVRRRIGSGAFATVWLAYDEQLDSPVAVKVLADNWTEDHQVRRRFLEEGRYLRRVDSPHVVRVYDAGELDDGRPYLVMTYADQGTLADRLGVDGLGPAQALEVVRQVGAGLTALHDAGILHRDVKPANVLFRSRPGPAVPVVCAMVADLGLGKALDVSSRLTMIAGTPSFVAPEQAQAEPLDARADQYSLGALSYLMLAGRTPYQHPTLQAAAHPGPPPPLSTDERAYPEAVEAVVRRALAPDREDRWPDVASYVEALGDALAPVVAGAPADTEPWLPLDPDLTQAGPRPDPPAVPETAAADPAPAQGGRPRRGRRARLAGAGALALVAGAAIGAAWAASGSGPAEVSLDDAAGTLSVTVPAHWNRAVADDGWVPPNDEAEQPALSAGTSAGWHHPDRPGQGVFVGLLPGAELPAQLPQHPECGEAEAPQDDRVDGDPSRTVVHQGCPAGVTVERVVQVTDDQLLWVQIRSADRATAVRVLDSVVAHGM